MCIGDFNLHIYNESNEASEFMDMLYAFALEQCVYFSTHVGGNYLDLVITGAANGIEGVICEPRDRFMNSRIHS